MVLYETGIWLYNFSITKGYKRCNRKQWHLDGIHIQNSYNRVIMYIIPQSY